MRTEKILFIIVILMWVTLFAYVLTGCSMISMERGAEGTSSYEHITFRGPPKDFKALDFKFGVDTRLKAGDAATAEQPWADVVGDIPELLLNMQAYCRAYPTMCVSPQ